MRTILICLTLGCSVLAQAQTSRLKTTGQYKEGEVIVHWKATASASQKHARSALRMRGLAIAHDFPADNMQHLQGQNSQSTEELMAQMQNDPDVEWVEPNYLISLSVSAPQVVAAGSDGGGAVSASSNTFTLTSANVQAQTAWTNFTPSGGALPIVAVLDSGVDLTHPALQNGLLTNAGEIANNGIDDDGNGYIDDVNGWNYVNNNANVTDCLGHGTHVSGIIRGVGQTITSSPAPTPLVKILPVKFLDCSGNGDTANAVSAIYYAISRGAVVINASWGGSQYSQTLHQAIAYAYSRNVVFVTAAGNATTNDDTTPTYPASLDVPNIISVAATDSSDIIASFSNFGLSTVHLAAPGVSIYSTYPGGQYAYYSGTSMASPMVAGVAALMISERPALNSYNVKTLVMGSVDNVNSLSSLVQTSGRLDINAAIGIAKSVVTLSAAPAYNILSSSVYQRSVASSSSGGSSGGGCGTIHAMGAKSLLESEEGGGSGGIGAMLAVMCAPLVVFIVLRVRAKKVKPAPLASRRDQRRVQHSMDISIRIDGKEIMARTRDLSRGGLAIVSEVALQAGALVEIGDGILGRVVWSKADNSLGIQIENGVNQWRSLLNSWTPSLQ